LIATRMETGVGCRIRLMSYSLLTSPVRQGYFVGESEG
jgi:hypothetical protein